MCKCILQIRLFFLIFLFSTSGCSQKATITDFNENLWKSDQNGCKEERLKLYTVLLKHQDDVLGLNNRQIIKLLGMPERNELFQRNQKFFIYNITPAPLCKSDYDQESLFLFIRFNAVGLCQEVFIRNQPNFKP
jgi:hypothetical protein